MQENGTPAKVPHFLSAKKHGAEHRAFFSLLRQPELLVELGDAAAGIDQLLLAREEGVTL